VLVIRKTLVHNEFVSKTKRQAASMTFLRLGTRPSRNLPTQRHSTTSSTGSQHDLPAPRDTPLGEPPDAKAQHDKLDRQPARPSCDSGQAPRRTHMFLKYIFLTVYLQRTLVLCSSILQHYFVEAVIIIHNDW